MIFLIIPLDKFDFKHDDIRLMTDNSPRDLPTKDNIVSCPYEMSLLSLDFIQLGAMRTLVDGAQPGDSFFFYCT
jgi:hypothetical protein